MQSALAQLIETELAKQHITRRTLAHEIGVTPINISRWLHAHDYDKGWVPWKHYPRLALFLNLPIDRILQAAKQQRPQDVDEYKKFVRDLKRLERR